MKLEAQWKQERWKIWSPRAEPVPDSPSLLYKISLCTTCMNRAVDLKRTLIQNLLDNRHYPHLEFVILNYNSIDDLHEFMLSAEIGPYLKSGRVRYIRTSIPRFYSSSHSHNVAFRNATGQIVLSLDADNFTGIGFADYVNRLANIRPRKAMFSRGKRRIHGRIGMYKDEFEALGGYDEDLIGYGYDDRSLMLRAMRAGFTLMWWTGTTRSSFARRIATPKDDVAINMEYRDWKESERQNRQLTLEKIGRGEVVANAGRNWGHIDGLEIYQ